jgi:carnitine 3-dehydrogenase
MAETLHRRWTPGSKIESPLQLYQCLVAPEWIDYNGHMTESSYLWAFGEATDALFRYIGIDEDYRAAGRSFYTVETHLNYYKEMLVNEPLRFTTQVLGLDRKRLHLFHQMYHGGNGALVCTTEQMLVHVDMKASAATPISPDVSAALDAIWQAHQLLPIPKQVGRQMKIARSQ